MDMKKYSVYITLFLFLLFGGIITGQEGEMHSGVNDEDQCAACHDISSGDRNSYPLKADVNGSCLACHPQDNTNHPVGMKPQFAVPGDMTLAADGAMTCVTCHDPHTLMYSDRPWQARSLVGRLSGLFGGSSRYHTYFLRRNNAHGELCLSCHGREGEE